MAPYLMSPMARQQLAMVQQRYPAKPTDYRLMDQRTGQPFTFGASTPPAAETQSGIDPNTGQPYAGGDAAGRAGGHTGVAANLDKSGLFGTEPSFSNYGPGLGMLGSFSGVPGMGVAGSAVGTGIDWNNAKEIFGLFPEMQTDPDYMSALGANLTHGFLGSSLVDQYAGMMGNAAAGFDPSGMGNSGGNAVSGPAGDTGFSTGGLVTKRRLHGPNPPGPDDGEASLKVGEHVLTQAQWKRLPKVTKKAVSR